MSDPIVPCLWFDGQAKAVAAFYASVFPDAEVLGGSPPVVSVRVGDLKLSLLDGGPEYKVNPSISFFYHCESEAQIDALWKALLEGGTAMMELGPYPYAVKYGWVADKYGVNWQLMLGKPRQKVFPSLMFVGKNCGRAEEALGFYASVFKDSKVGSISRYGAGAEPDSANSVNYGELYAGGTWLSVMDSAYAHDFAFDDGVSLVIGCENQEEIDYYWERLTEGGSEVQCGWLKDKYGVSWQVVPKVLEELMADPERSKRVVDAFMKMKKFDIAALLRA